MTVAHYEPEHMDPSAFDPRLDRARRRRFRDPGGRSALHPGTRRHPCPTCKEPNRLTDADVRSHYQCDACADAAEGQGF